MEPTASLSELPLPLTGKRKRGSDDKDESEEDRVGAAQVPDCEGDEDGADLDGDEYEEPYSADLEQPPRCAYLHPSFKRAESMRAEIPQKLLNILAAAKHSDAGTAHMKDTALNLQIIDYDPRMIVGVFGMTGAGKSSLINSLLDAPMLAGESAAGSACTNVVTEFHKASDAQTSPLLAQVHLHDADTWATMLRKTLAAYRKHYFDDLSLVQDDEQELKDRRKAAMTAFTTLRTLCCNMPQFQTEEASHESIMKAYKEGRAGALYQKMMESVQELCATLNSRHNICEMTASSARELHKKNIYWPHHVSIPTFGQGYTGSLPGISDTNQVRVDTTMGYLRDCGCILVIEEIFRAKDSERVDEHLRKILQQGLAPVLVCTKTDELGNSSSEDIMKDKIDATLLQKLKEIEDEMFELKEELQENSRALRRAAAKNKSELKVQNEGLSQRVQSLCRELAHEKILARNRSVSEITRENFERSCQTSVELQVLCVSNTTYGKYKSGFKETDRPFLTVEETSIPALRAFLYSLSAGDMFAQLERACKAPLTDLFSNVQLWTTETDVESQDHLANIARRPRTDCNDVIAKFCTDLKSVAFDTVVDHMNALEEKWTDAAVLLHNNNNNNNNNNNWHQWHHATYSAFIRHNGDHGTSTKARQSWNAALLAPVIVDLEPCFGWLAEKRQRLEGSLDDGLNALFDTVCVDLEAENTGLPLDGFFTGLKAKKAMVSECISKMSKKLGKAIRRSKLDATVNNPSSHLPKGMSKIYEDCAEVTGKDSVSRKKEMKVKYLKSSSPFRPIHQGFQSSLDEDIRVEADALKDAVTKVYRSMEQDFANLFYRQGMRNPKAQELRSELEDFLRWARAQVDGPIKEALDEAGRVNSRSLNDAQPTFAKVEEEGQHSI